MAKERLKVAILYRVIQDWRAPVFERLANQPDWDVTVFHGCDFAGTKVVNTKRPLPFSAVEMRSLAIRWRGGSGSMMLVPLSPSLLLHLFRFRPDVVICEGASNFLNDILAFLYCSVARVPIVQWGLGEIRGGQRSFFRKLVDTVFVPIERRSDAVICYSSFGAGYYRRIGVSEEKIIVAVNVVDTELRRKEIEKVKPEEIEEKSGFHVLFVGALEPLKRVDRLLQAFAVLQESRPNTYLTIVGDGSAKESLVEMASNLGLKNTIFRGKVVDGVSKYFLSADVFVLPGLGGLAVSDALVHGLPVICTVGDGCETDLIENGVNGIWEETLDVTTLSGHLLRLYDSPWLLEKMKENAKAVLSKYDIGNYVRQIRAAVEVATGKGL